MVTIHLYTAQALMYRGDAWGARAQLYVALALARAYNKPAALRTHIQDAIDKATLACGHAI